MERLLIYSDTYMPLLVIVLYISLVKHIQQQERFILFYSIFNFVLFAITDILSITHKNNMPLYHLDSLLEVWMVAFYMMYKITGKKFSKAFYITGAAYTLFFACNLLLWEKPSVFNSNSAGVGSLIILFLSMYYLLKLSKTDEILYFQKLPSFWIASGFLIYNAVSVLVLLSYKYFTYIHMEKMGDTLWFVLSAAIIVKFALISTGLLCHKKRQATHLPFLL